MGVSWLTLAGIVLVFAAAVVVLALLERLLPERGKKSKGRVGDGPGEATPFRACEGLLTRAEAEFYHVLKRAVEEEAGVGGEGGAVVVMAKVRLLDLVELPRGTERARNWRTRVQSKHVDFVVCEAAGRLRPRVVVELDDASHERADRRERDEWVDRVLEGAGVRVVRVRGRGRGNGGYGVGEVRGLIPLAQERIAASNGV